MQKRMMMAAVASAAALLLGGCNSGKAEQEVIKAQLDGPSREELLAESMRVSSVIASRIASMPITDRQKLAVSQLASAFEYAVHEQPIGVPQAAASNPFESKEGRMVHAYGRLLDASTCVQGHFSKAAAAAILEQTRSWIVVTPQNRQRMIEIDQHVAGLSGYRLMPTGSGCVWLDFGPVVAADAAAPLADQVVTPVTSVQMGDEVFALPSVEPASSASSAAVADPGLASGVILPGMVAPGVATSPMQAPSSVQVQEVAPGQPTIQTTIQPPPQMTYSPYDPAAQQQMQMQAQPQQPQQVQQPQAQ